jgi:hypothetical protein
MVRTLIVLGTVSLLGLSGCAKTKVATVQEYEGKERLPKPTRILVHDFAVSPHEVSVNSAIGARIERIVTNTSTDEEKLKEGRAVAQLLSLELVQQLELLGFPAERSTVVEPPANRTLVIEGQFMTIDEGNRIQRMVIGFGLGGTEVRTQVQASLGTPSGRLLLEEFVTDAESSKKPGMGPMAGVGGLVTGVASAAVVSGGVGAVTEMDQTVEGDARRTAHEIVKKLVPLFVKEGWIPADYLGR